MRTIPKACYELDRSYDTIRRWLHEASIDTAEPVIKSKLKKEKTKEDKKISKLETRVPELEERWTAMEQQGNSRSRSLHREALTAWETKASEPLAASTSFRRHLPVAVYT